MLGVVRGSQPTSIFEDNIILFQEHASRQGTCIYLHTDVLSQTICLSGAFSVVSSYHWVTALALRFIIPVAAQGHPHTSRCLISFLLRKNNSSTQPLGHLESHLHASITKCHIPPRLPIQELVCHLQATLDPCSLAQIKENAASLNLQVPHCC